MIVYFLLCFYILNLKIGICAVLHKPGLTALLGLLYQGGLNINTLVDCINVLMPHRIQKLNSVSQNRHNITYQLHNNVRIV